MRTFKAFNTLAGWVVFLLSAIVYLFTLEPTVSFWDCGEFIASAYKLQIGHPPGAPFFMLSMRIFALLSPSPEKVALFMNAFSALVSAATIMFLYWTIVRLAERFLTDNTTASKITIAASGFVGAMTFAFSDTFWFSAVEAEVYAMSSLFTAVVFWAILKWEEEFGQSYANRWLVLIAYLIGLSIGVHLLNLLAIPAIALVWYFKHHKATAKGIVATLAISAVTIAAIMWGIIQGTPKFAQNVELLFVNGFGLNYNSGILAFIVLLFAISVYVIRYSVKKNKPLLHLCTVSLAMIYLGFLSYAVISIRSAANPPMDQNNPENAYSLMKYLSREQYGETPLLFGYYYNAPATGVKEGKPVYYPKDGKYIKKQGSGRYTYDGRFRTFFPRMYSNSPSHINAYQNWGDIKGRPVSVNGQTDYIPTFSENMRFFFSYQLNHMYIRYFLWNFSGRQNDLQGYGDNLNGNWLTGFGFIDKARLGHNGTQPASMANPKTTNRYFMLPLLLGLVGMFIQYRKHRKDFWVVMLLFFMTGIAIVLFLNQYAYQPRERDYAYAGSFYAFAIWIGLGVYGIADLFQKKLSAKTSAIVAASLSASIPVLVLAQNFDDHNRSGRYAAADIGKNYLQSCDKNAILFTYGDNDTFPLWYAQDVEGVRTDVRVCNVTLLNMDWYIDQMRWKAYQSEPLPIKMPAEKYEHDNRNVVFLQDNIDRYVELSTLLNIALSDDEKAMVRTQGGDKYNFIPTRKVKISVDKEQVLKSGTVSASKAHLIEDSLVFEIQGRYFTKSDLIILDMLANNQWVRPIYFDLSVVNTTSIKLQKYLQHEGFAFRLVPIKDDRPMLAVSTAIFCTTA
jgi:hypothetical protein